MSLYLVQYFLEISKNLEQGNSFGSTLGKFCPISKRLFIILSGVGGWETQ